MVLTAVQLAAVELAAVPPGDDAAAKSTAARVVFPAGAVVAPVDAPALARDLSEIGLEARIGRIHPSLEDAYVQLLQEAP